MTRQIWAPRAVRADQVGIVYPSLEAFSSDMDEAFAGGTRLQYEDAEWGGGGPDDPAPREAIRKGTTGELEQINDLIKSTAMSNKLSFQQTHDVVGDYVNIDLYLQGEAECMVSTPLVPVPVPMVHVLVDVCFSGAINRVQIEKRGRSLVAAIDAARMQGMRVKVTSMCLGSNSDEMRLAWHVSDTRFAYNPELVFYACSSPQLLRMWFHSTGKLFWNEHNKNMSVTPRRGYTDKDREFFADLTEGEKYLLVDGEHLHDHVNKTPAEWLEELRKTAEEAG